VRIIVVVGAVRERQSFVSFAARPKDLKQTTNVLTSRNPFNLLFSPFFFIKSSSSLDLHLHLHQVFIFIFILIFIFIKSSSSLDLHLHLHLHQVFILIKSPSKQEKEREIVIEFGAEWCLYRIRRKERKKERE